MNFKRQKARVIQRLHMSVTISLQTIPFEHSHCSAQKYTVDGTQGSTIAAMEKLNGFTMRSELIDIIDSEQILSNSI